MPIAARMILDAVRHALGKRSGDMVGPGKDAAPDCVCQIAQVTRAMKPKISCLTQSVVMSGGRPFHNLYVHIGLCGSILAIVSNCLQDNFVHIGLDKSTCFGQNP